MWVFTDNAFLSVVKKRGHDDLCVRARAADDLDAFRRYCPELGPAIMMAGTDYPVRAFVSREALAQAVARAILEIDYENFKGRVAETLGPDRAAVYHDIWHSLLALEREPRRGAPRVKPGKRPGRSKKGVS